MRVILLQDVPKVGRKYDEKTVSDGYALNFLIPRSLAEIANEKARARAELMRQTIVAHRTIQEDLALKNLTALAEVKLSIEGKASGKGHLFAGVHAEEISKALKDQCNIDVPADFIDLAHPLKEVGEHIVKVKIQDKTSEFKVTITAKK